MLNTQPSLPLSDYVGRYEDPLYGVVQISLESGQLRFAHNDRTFARLDHWHYDTFRAVYDRVWYGKSLVSFQLDEMGKVSGVSGSGMSFAKPK